MLGFGLGPITAMSLTSVTGSTEDKLKEEKKKTEAERQKNGNESVLRERDSLTTLFIYFFRNAPEETGIDSRGADEDTNSVSKGDRQVGEDQQGTQETTATSGRKQKSFE